MCDNASDNLPEIVLTRPEDGARAFHVLIQDVLPKAKVTKSPLIKIKFIPILPDLEQFNGVIFTSTNGVIATKKKFVPPGILCFTVGSKTAQAAKKLGFKILCSEETSENLISEMLSHPIKGTLVHVRGEYTRGKISSRLNKNGFDCYEIIAYKQAHNPLNFQARKAFKSKRPLLIPLFSRRTAQLLLEEALPMEKCHIVAMSEAVSEPFEQTELANITIAKSPDIESMLETVVKTYNLITLLQRRNS